MKLTITDNEAVPIVVHVKSGEATVVAAGKSLEADCTVMMVHGVDDYHQAQHGFADAVGITSHSAGGSPTPIAVRMGQALTRIGKAVKGE